MKAAHYILRYSLFVKLLFFSTLLYSQINYDAYGIETKDFKKLFFKMRIKTTTNQTIKGYLNALNDTSVVISTIRHILVALFTDITIGIVDYDRLMFTGLSAELALISVPLAFIASIFVNKAHYLKIKLYGNLDTYQFETANMRAYMIKKIEKKVNFLELENRVRKKLK